MTIRAASTVQLGQSILHWDYFARQADRQLQEPLEPVVFPTYSYNFVLREPIGVCAAIVPWNFPLADGRLEAGARAGLGNTVVLKPAAQTPLTALRLAELVAEAGLPRRRAQRHHRVRRRRSATSSSSTRTSTRSPSPARPVGRQDHASSPPATIKRVHARARRQVAEHRLRRRRPRRRRRRRALGDASSTEGRPAVAGTRLIVAGVDPRRVRRAGSSSAARGDQARRHARPDDGAWGRSVSAEQLERVARVRRDRESTRAPGWSIGGAPATARARAGSSSRRSSPTSRTGVTIAQEEIFGPVLSVITVRRRGRGDRDRQRHDLRAGRPRVWTQDTDRALRGAGDCRPGRSGSTTAT